MRWRRLAGFGFAAVLTVGFTAGGGCMSTAPNPSGVTMPVGNVTTPDATFAPLYFEDFNTPKALGTIGPANATWDWYGYDWSGDHEFLDPGGNAYYAPLKVASVHDGQLDLHFHTGTNGRHYLATMNAKTNQLYGRFSIRMKASGPMPGYHITPLLWPAASQPPWPQLGEIDFPDVWMDSASSKVSAFMHHMGATEVGDQDWFDSGITPYQWVTWTMDWLPNKVIFYKNNTTTPGVGTVFGTSTTRIPSTSMRWVIQFDSEAANPIADATQGNILIDWAIAYRKV